MAESDASAAAVRYTLAIGHALRPTVKLPGTVKSRHRSIIGSETEGIVIALHVREGEVVSEGTSLAQLRTDILEQRLNAANSSRDAINVKRELTTRSLERVRQLFNNSSMPEQRLDELSYELQGLQVEEQRLTAEIAAIKLSIDHSHIRAPFDGVIIARHTDIGEWREVGDPIVELLSVSDLEVDVAVPEIYFHDLHGIKTAEVAFTSVSDQRFVMELSALVPLAAPESRNFTVKFRVPDDLQGHQVAVGMLADVWLPLGQTNTATLVPKDAIVQRQEEHQVMVIDDNNQTRIVPVITGKSSGAWIEIRGDVTAGDRVIVRGNERMQAGQTVEATLLNYQLP
jgi:RND family efflux transporter MFP subunit